MLKNWRGVSMMSRNEYLPNDLILELVKDYIKTLLIRLFKLSNVKHTLEYTISLNVFYEYALYRMGVYADIIYKRIHKKIKAKQKRKKFYAILKKLENRGVIVSKKMDGLTFLEPHDLHKKILLNLIYKLQNSNSKFQKQIFNLKLEFDPKPSYYRKWALIEFCKTRTLNIFDRLKLEFVFKQYLKDIEDKVILLYNKHEDKLLKLKYRTRFNDESKLYERIALFNSLFENASYKFKNAVFLTLTLDPKNFFNLYQASKEVSKALNRFLSYLKRKFKQKISYINVFEFQRNGLIHLHLVLFGFKWLLPQKVLSKIWQKYGMGKIVYIYKLVNDGVGFCWAKNRPQKAKENYIDDYLSKYLKKSFYEIKELALFWLTNKRFFTYSRDLKDDNEEEENIRVKKGYEFLGVFDYEFLDKFEDDGDLINFIWEINHKGIIGYVLATYGGDYG